MLIISGASYVILPAFARISDDRERFVGAFKQSLRWFAAVSMPLGLILVPMGVSLAVVLFGEVWRDAGYAAMALAPFVAAATLISVISEALKAEGRPQILVRIHTVTVAAGTAAMVALLGFELVGVAAGFSLGSCVGAGYALVRIGGVLDLPVRDMARQMAPAAIAAIAMAAVLLPIDRVWLDPPSHSTVVGLLLLAAEGLAGFAFYAGLLLMLAPDTLTRGRELVNTARGRAGAESEAPA